MNKSDFILLIKEPTRLGKSELSSLKKVEADFPFFQSTQVLLAKSLSNLNHYDFSKQLHKTSLTVPNREILYNYLHDRQVEEPVLIVPEPLTKLIDEALPKIEDNKPEEAQPVALNVEEEVTHELIEADKTEAVYESVEQEIVHEIVEAESNAPDEIVEKIALEPSELSSTIQTHKQELHSFEEWLALSKGKKLKTEQVTPQKEVVQEVTETKETPIELHDSKEIKGEEKETTPSSVVVFESILDKFIRESPSISRPKATFYSPANMAKQSVEEDEDLVTETLAKLYHQQGHYKKAIRAYEKLCLIYPHKMAYFADLIQQIKLESKD